MTRDLQISASKEGQFTPAENYLIQLTAGVNRPSLLVIINVA